MSTSVSGGASSSTEVNAWTVDDICHSHGLMDAWNLEIEVAEIASPQRHSRDAT